jgi:hypothetical protein
LTWRSASSSRGIRWGRGRRRAARRGKGGRPREGAGAAQGSPSAAGLGRPQPGAPNAGATGPLHREPTTSMPPLNQIPNPTPPHPT